ncbi:MAG: two-component system, NtrC family, response regulator AtoC [Candidatus Poribacteria bacterium]|nr:two-component system, NtrC family, response regulator AtoC [Candidatus Poribacteria bacterium]
MVYLRVLIVDDEEDIRDILSDRLQAYGYEVLTAIDGIEALEKVEKASPDLVLLDIQLPGLDGMEVLSRIKRDHPQITVIMITAHGRIQLAVDAMKQGAYDFVEKPFDPDLIRIKVDNALERHSLLNQNEYLRSELKGEYGEIIGKSQKMLEVLEKIEKVASSDSTVLITGETGTGKDLVARALHRNSPRSSGHFVAINCTAIPATLLESEIFGHERGAFTGAITRKIGKMEYANRGTLFLDEIGDMAYELQSKLLTAIEKKEIERIGSTQTIKVDVRFIAATHRNLQEAIQDGKFREDLYYRINVVNIHLPPLREIKEDIPLLVDHFLSKYSIVQNKKKVQITDKAMRILMNYNWPGNIRQLQNCIEGAILLASSNIVNPEDLPQQILSEKVVESIQDDLQIKSGMSLKYTEKALILKTLKQANGNKTEAAKLLGISLRGLHYKLKEYNIE